MENANLFIFGGILVVMGIVSYRRYAQRQDEQDAVATWAALHGYERQ